MKVCFNVSCCVNVSARSSEGFADTVQGRAMKDTKNDAVLDAVREEVITYGLTRARMTSIAQRAGISRATLYRRARSLEEIVLDTLVADFDDLLLAVTPTTGEVTRADIVAAGRRAVEEFGRNAFVRALLEHDAHLLVPYLVERFGRSQEAVLTALRVAITAAQSNGTVRDGDPRVLSVGVMQAMMPYIISVRPLAGVAPKSVWLDEISLLLDRYLAPEPPGSGDARQEASVGDRKRP